MKGFYFMNREQFIEIIKQEIENESLLNIDKDYITKNYKTAKGGIYFLYNDNDVVIYVGKVGNGKHTSFYKRMYGHGNSAHCNKPWFNQAKKFRFKKFPNLINEEILKIERLMIYAKNQPIYNDIIISQKEFMSIVSKI